MENDEALVTAQDLERRGIMRRGTAYRMAEAGKLPHYIVGCSGRGVRFRVSEIVEALRRPISAPATDMHV